MLDEDDLWLADELASEDIAVVRYMMPEVKQALMHHASENEAGFRSVLEHPEQCSRAWWRPSRGRPLYAA